ncbi:hypothetical protein ACFL1E_00915 [Candidatus Omnitrophota bacterium]
MTKKEIVITAVSLFVIVLLAGNTLFLNKILNQDDKKALITIMENLQIGDEKERVENIFSRHRTDALELKKSEDYEGWEENQWLIQMPVEFGATDWILWIEFVDEKVASLKIRLHDSKDLKPKGTPPDK